MGRRDRRQVQAFSSQLLADACRVGSFGSQARFIVTAFRTTKQAKDYLAERIASEASREGNPLTEVERKMLYFSETDWTLPEMTQISSEFDRDYDANAFEQRIAALVAKIVAGDRSQNQTATGTWDEAVEKLSDGDHYLNVLLDARDSGLAPAHGFLSTLKAGTARPRHDRLKLWVIALAIVIVLLGFFPLMAWTFGDRVWTIYEILFGEQRGKLWIALAVIAWLIWLVKGDLKVILSNLLKRS